MNINTSYHGRTRALLPYTVICTCLLQACAQDSDQTTPTTDSQPVTSVVEEMAPLRDGLQEFAEPDNRYANAAYQASKAYKGTVDLAALDTKNAGAFTTNVLMGPLSAANTPNGVPLTTGNYGIEGALFPGWPVAILSRIGLGHPPAETRSFGTSQYENIAAYHRQFEFQSPWWNIFSNAVGGQTSCSGGGTVTWSNNLLVDNTDGGDERSITWDNCRYPSYVSPYYVGSLSVVTEGISLHGSARLYQQAIGQYAIAWDAVEYRADNRIWRISGVETSRGEFGCGFDQQRLSNLLIESVDSGDAVLLENFRTSIVGEPPESRVCGASGLFNNWYEGRILHSRLGAVDISTPTHLDYLSPSTTIDKLIEWPAADPNDAEKKLRGHVLVRGLNSSEIRIEPETFRRFGDTHSAEYTLPEMDAVAITVTSSDGASSRFHFARYQLQGVTHGAFADLGDDDADGMPNAWEKVFNFDPADATDGEQDIDGDGLSNAEEYRQMTTPYRFDNPKVDTDTAITIKQQYYWLTQSAEDKRQLLFATVTAPTLGHGYSRKNWPVVLTLQGAARFAAQELRSPYSNPGTCRWGGNDQTLICDLVEVQAFCSWNGCNNRGIEAFVTVEMLSDQPATMVATIAHGSADPNPENDTTAIMLKFQR